MFDATKRFNIFYRFSKMYHQELDALKILHGFTDSVIASRRKELITKIETNSDNNNDELGIKKKTAFLDLLLKSTIEGQPLSNEDIREEVDTFMFEVDCVILNQTKK